MSEEKHIEETMEEVAEEKPKPSKSKKVKVQFIKSADVNGIVRMVGSEAELSKSEADDLKDFIKIIN